MKNLSPLRKMKATLRSVLGDRAYRTLGNVKQTVASLGHSETYIKNVFKGPVVNAFHKLYYHSERHTILNTYWLGTRAVKCPLDLWIYQEIIFELKPDVIIECGTERGGSALFLASMCDLVNSGKVITIDLLDDPNRPQHARIKYLTGSSTSEEIIEQVGRLISAKDIIMVILDSDHRKEHVLNELRIWSRLVTKGSYIVVEDTNINGHPVLPKFGTGPMEAVHAFLNENGDFVIDTAREKLFLTMNPKGYLRRDNTLSKTGVS